MNVTESCDLNTLLQWLLDDKRRRETITEAVAREAAIRLIERGNKTLMAGLRPDEVRALWTVPLKRRKTK